MKDIKKIKKDLGMILIGAIPFFGGLNYITEYTLREEYSRRFSVSTSLSRTLAISIAILDGAGAADASIGYYNRASMIFASSAILKTAAYAINTRIVRKSLTNEYEGMFPFGAVIKHWRHRDKDSNNGVLESMLDGA